MIRRRLRLPLRGPDLVLMGMQHPWRRAGVSSNAVLVVECDGPIAASRVASALERFLARCPWPGARLGRPFPWGKRAWTVSAAARRHTLAVRQRQAGSAEGARHAIEAELNAAIDPRREPPVRLCVVEPSEAGRSWLILTWFHPLMDPRGAQNLLGHLAAVDRADVQAPGRAPRPAPERHHMGDVVDGFVRAPDARPLRERGRLARLSLAHMRQLGDTVVVSPGTGRVPTGRIRFLLASAAAGRRSEPALAREISWRLAVVGRVMTRLWRRRGLPETPFLVPVAVDLRAKGTPGPIVGNTLGFHFARFHPADTGAPARLAAALRAQMADAQRAGLIDANAAAMDFLQYRPLGAVLGKLPWATGGETFSFNCADVGAIPTELDTIFGRRVVNAYHVPAVPPRPGIGVFFNRCGETDNVVVAWADGAVEDAEAESVLAAVIEDLGWRATSDGDAVAPPLALADDPGWPAVRRA